MPVLAGVILVPFISAALIPLVNMFGPKARDIFAVVCGFIIAALTLAMIPMIRQGSGLTVQWLPGINIGVNLDALSVNIAVIAGTIGSLIVLFSTKYMAKEDGLMRYYALTLLFIGGMIGLVLSDNLLTLYIFWEIVGLCSYALIGFFYKDPKAVRAGIKAFITTRVGDVGLLIGILLLYLNTNTFNISEIFSKAGTIPAPLLAFCAFMFMLGAIGKSAQVPLHVWLPDAMEAPTTTSALIHAATMVNAGVYLMARMYPLFSPVAGWALTLTWVGVITALVAASMALVEKDLKRVLAYSTVSQLGFMMFGIGVGSVFASQFHLMSHAIFKALLFLSAGAIIHEVGTRNMFEMGGLFKQMKITAICFGAGALALMGIPVMNGFFSKDMILAAAYTSHNYWPLAFASVAAVFTILYTLRAYSLVFLGNRKGAHVHDAPWAMTSPLVILAIGSLVSWTAVVKLNHLFSRSGLHVENISFGEFFKEMFLSPMILLTIFIVVAGILVYIGRKQISNSLSFVVRPFLSAAAAGFGFDIFYNYCIARLFDGGKIVLNVFDEGIMNHLNYQVGSLFFSFSQLFRRTHTGELDLNLFGMVLGIAFVIAIVFWR